MDHNNLDKQPLLKTILLIKYMKQGLLLTLKELIKLGIIKTKRRKRKSQPLTTMSSMGRGPTGIPLSIQSRRYNEFISATNPSPAIAYTDNLRLRDEQSNFNTRLLEYKNQLENEKSLLENRQKEIIEDINYSKSAVGNELQKLYNKMNRNTNWEEDNNDIPQTFGSDSFKSQRDEIIEQPLRPPEYLQLQPSEDEEILPAKSPRGRPKSTIPLPERRKQSYLKRKEKKKLEKQQFLGEGDDESLKGFLQSLDEEGLPTKIKKKRGKP